MRFFIIFAVGAAILALELTASRILKPYFGDSLYIWAAILSATLLCMALGYGLGGRLSRKFSHGGQAFFFNHALALSALAILVVSGFYPLMFRELALLSLVGGCFFAAFWLIGPALVMLAALPPLLVALHRQPLPGTLLEAEEGQNEAQETSQKTNKRTEAQPSLQLTENTGDDAGAGWVYAFETLGAICGVLGTAFVLMPAMSAYHAYMLIGGMLAVLALISIRTDPHINPVARQHVGRTAIVSLMVGGGLYMIAWMNGGSPVAVTPQDGFVVKASVPSPFGGLKVVDFEDVEGQGWQRMLLHEGIAQGVMNISTRPAALYQYFMPGLGEKMTQDGDQVLVLGAGAGMIPMEMLYMARKVDAVEIDPAVTRLGEEMFTLDSRRVGIYHQDARTFMRKCPKKYDLVIIDLFRGDGVPEHLVTKEFFTDIRNCMNEDGGMILNMLYADTAKSAAMALMATIRDVFGRVAFTRPDINPDKTDGIVNAYIFTHLDAGYDLSKINVFYNRIPMAFKEELDALIRNVIVYDGQSNELDGIQPMVDEDNPWRRLTAPYARQYRHAVVKNLHKALLVN